MKPPIGYFGAKTTVADKIVALMPEHKGYCEPFAGSLAILLAKPVARIEVVNDLDNRLMTFWRVLRDRPDELERLVRLTPHSRAELIESARLDAGDELHLAHQVYVLLTQGRSRTLHRSGFRTYVDPNGTSSSFHTTLRAFSSRLAPAAERLFNVTLECRPGIEVIRDYGKHVDNLLYVDPPYVSSSRRGGRYSIEMGSERDHRDLAEALNDCDATVMLSGYDSPLYEELYRNWERHVIPTHTGNGIGDKSRTEVVWMNRQVSNPDTPLELFRDAPMSSVAATISH